MRVFLPEEVDALLSFLGSMAHRDYDRVEVALAPPLDRLWLKEGWSAFWEEEFREAGPGLPPRRRGRPPGNVSPCRR